MLQALQERQQTETLAMRMPPFVLLVLPTRQSLPCSPRSDVMHAICLLLPPPQTTLARLMSMRSGARVGWRALPTASGALTAMWAHCHSCSPALSHASTVICGHTRPSVTVQTAPFLLMIMCPGTQIRGCFAAVQVAQVPTSAAQR
jgi:hypothetical protein